MIAAKFPREIPAQKGDNQNVRAVELRVVRDPHRAQVHGELTPSARQELAAHDGGNAVRLEEAFHEVGFRRMPGDVDLFHGGKSLPRRAAPRTCATIFANGEAMAIIRILSAGAAQAVVEKIAAGYSRDTGYTIEADFSAVGAMKARVAAGEAVDIIILTGALIDELVESGQVARGSRADLGTVGTGVAVRAGTPLPDVSSARVLRGNLLAATKVVCPDPATATAGKVVMQALECLGIVDPVKPHLRFFPNGYAAMRDLAGGRAPYEMGITQITEILANPGVTYVGPLPGELQARTVYSAGLASRSAEPGAARDFISRLTGASARPVLAAAGYEFDR